MPRLFLLLLLGTAMLAGGWMALHNGNCTVCRDLWGRFVLREDDAYSVERLQIDLMDQLNQTRVSSGQPLLRYDAELSRWLDQRLQDGQPLDRLSACCEALMNERPRYLDVTVGSASGTSLQALRSGYAGFVETPHAEPYTHMGFAMRETAAGLGREAVLMLVRRLRDFKPELLHQAGDTAFYAECQHCQHGHALRAPPTDSSSTLECPKCGRIYAVVATDSEGRSHYVNEFLTGYQPPAIYPPRQSRIEQMFAIWSAVQSSCLYTRDPGEKRQSTDRWQLAMETQNLGQGDCEDSAILLTDWLTSRGMEARVVLGKYGDIGGHAWTVTRVDDREYLLESTSAEQPDVNRPPLVSRVGGRYMPEVMFDREYLYVRTNPRAVWDGEYWSEKTWIKLKLGHPTQLDDILATRDSSNALGVNALGANALGANALGANALGGAVIAPQQPAAQVSPGLALTQPFSPRSSPFLGLLKLKPSDSTWKLMNPLPNWRNESQPPTWQEAFGEGSRSSAGR
ncbi:MAG: transglutaminase domain-containing protein [Verrucomicrobiales bacterium]|nr:transglutaminase domain-containing protein [Verrucomicrobiales bacterium]